MDLHEEDSRSEVKSDRDSPNKAASTTNEEITPAKVKRKAT